jgi:hypothetical protein
LTKVYSVVLNAACLANRYLFIGRSGFGSNDLATQVYWRIKENNFVTHSSRRREKRSVVLFASPDYGPSMELTHFSNLSISSGL